MNRLQATAFGYGKISITGALAIPRNGPSIPIEPASEAMQLASILATADLDPSTIDYRSYAKSSPS